MIGGSAPGNKSESNVSELWHTRLCGWPTANRADTADLSIQNRGSFNTLLAMWDKWFQNRMRQESMTQMAFLAELCDRMGKNSAKPGFCN